MSKLSVVQSNQQHPKLAHGFQPLRSSVQTLLNKGALPSLTLLRVTNFTCYIPWIISFSFTQIFEGQEKDSLPQTLQYLH